MKEKMAVKILVCLYVIIALLAANIVVGIINVNQNYTFTSSSGGSGSGDNNSGEEIPDEYDISKFVSIEVKDIKTESKGKKAIIYLGRADCDWCRKYAPILTKVTEEYNLRTLYIDVTAIDAENGEILEALGSADDKEYMKNNFRGTPMTIIVKDNKVIDSIPGFAEEADLIKFLEDNGFKK